MTLLCFRITMAMDLFLRLGSIIPGPLDTPKPTRLCFI
jgi:hypothetical protein